MEKVRFGIIGMGNMGSAHAEILLSGKVEGAVLTAICDLDSEKFLPWKKYGLKEFNSSEELIRSGEVDAVLVATYHYSHPDISIDALNNGLHVFCEKPTGVYTKQVRLMNKVAQKAGKVFSSGFCLRTRKINQKIHEIIANGEIGEIKRINWISTNWYRPQSYYDSSSWRATWAGEGGGILLNQAPHTLDLLWYFTGLLPTKMQSNCYFGKWHDIEVEDDVTAFFEYENGATGTLVLSTADAPGSERLEILGNNGRLLLEGGKLTKTTLDIGEREFNATYKGGFGNPEASSEVVEVEPDEKPIHDAILQNFTNAILHGERLIAPGEEGINSLEIANAILLASWLNEKVSIPVDEEKYLAELNKRVATSRKKEGASVKLDLNSSLSKYKK
ncbi:MAG: Gfo/Idh/MocA family oxidoreductase [Clostridia bacterium]|nr:Gfo/Idh/MocA family oxidoreductase [Clostridia bacterium]